MDVFDLRILDRLQMRDGQLGRACFGFGIVLTFHKVQDRGSGRLPKINFSLLTLFILPP